MKAHKATWMTATLILSLSLLGGCAVIRGSMGDTFKDEDVAALKKGVTTRAQVPARMGPPCGRVDGRRSCALRLPSPMAEDRDQRDDQAGGRHLHPRWEDHVIRGCGETRRARRHLGLAWWGG